MKPKSKIEFGGRSGRQDFPLGWILGRSIHNWYCTEENRLILKAFKSRVPCSVSVMLRSSLKLEVPAPSPQLQAGTFLVP
jgi:hypothetical protein